MKEWVGNIAQNYPRIRSDLFEINFRAYDRLGKWRTEYEIKIEEIGKFFAKFDKLRKNGSTCVIPLHGENTPEPTGEHVLYDFEQSKVLFNDTVFERPRSLPASDLQDTLLAQRMRFWHEDFKPEEIPVFSDTPHLDQRYEAVSPLPPKQRKPWFNELRTFVRKERSKAREQGWERYQDEDRYLLEIRKQAVSDESNHHSGLSELRDRVCL